MLGGVGSLGGYIFLWVGSGDYSNAGGVGKGWGFEMCIYEP